MKDVALILSLLLCTLFSGYVMAEDKPEDAQHPPINKPLQVMPSKIKPVQSGTEEFSKAAPENSQDKSERLDSLSFAKDMAFPSNFWSDVDYAAYTQLLNITPVNTSPALRNLYLRTLATTEGQPQNKADAPKEDGEKTDIYTLKLNKLVELGDFENALKLYKLNEGNPPSESAAVAGVTAMIGTGETGLACLESKALEGVWRKDPQNARFWQDNDILCQALVSPASGEDETLRIGNAARIFLASRKFASMSDVLNFNTETAAFRFSWANSGQMVRVIDSKNFTDSLTDSSLAFLLHTKAQVAETTTILMSYARRKGIKVPEDIASRVVQELPKTVPQKQTPLITPAKKVYAIVSATTPYEMAELKTILGISYIAEGLIDPLRLTDSVLANPELDSTQRLKLIKVFLLNNAAPPTSLITSVYKEIVPESGDSPESLLQRALLKKYEKDGAKTAQLLALSPIFHGDKNPLDVNISVYDNILSLTDSGNYVMPKGEILSSLRKSAEQKLMGKAVIESLNIMLPRSTESLHPVEMYEVLKALNNVGLNEETMSLARQALGNLLEI